MFHQIHNSVSFVFFTPSSVVARVAIRVDGVLFEQICCVLATPRRGGMFAAELVAIVVLQLELDGPYLAHECSVGTFHTALCMLLPSLVAAALRSAMMRSSWRLV